MHICNIFYGLRFLPYSIKIQVECAFTSFSLNFFRNGGYIASLKEGFLSTQPLEGQMVFMGIALTGLAGLEQECLRGDIDE